MKKTYYIIISILIISLMLSGCKGEGQDTPSETVSSPPSSSSADGVFTLAYCSNDVFNPYTSTTKVNRELSLLLYDTIVKLDEKFKPQHVLSNSIVINGNHCVVSLKDARFSDSTSLTANDVVYSITQAKASTSKYASQLSKVVSYSAVNSNAVSIILSESDPYFTNLLDFPIIKANSDSLRNENNLPLPPIGTGRYTVDIEKTILIANEQYHLGTPSIKTINLINTPDSEALNHAVEVGSVSVYFSDLSDGNIPSMSGTLKTVDLPNLIYLGVNYRNAALAVPEMRYAISAALDRKAVGEVAYHSYAKPASGVFSSSFSDAAEHQNIEASKNINIAVANLNKIGYNSKDSEGYFCNGAGKRLSFSLICNSENASKSAVGEMIKNQLAAAGIHITLEILDYNTYMSRLTQGSFDLYVAETKISNNMDITNMVTEGGTAAYGIVAAQMVPPMQEDAQEPSNFLTSAAAMTGFKKGELTIADVIAAFNSEMPLIPICYRTGAVIYGPDIEAPGTATISDAYYGIEKFHFK